MYKICFDMKKVPEKITKRNEKLPFPYWFSNVFKFSSELRFENATMEDSGNYTCVATNKGAVTETSGTLNVLGTSVALVKTLNNDDNRILGANRSPRVAADAHVLFYVIFVLAVF
jgi:hypothetical protein